MRIAYAGAAYHVMGRGHQGRAIYADDRDRKRWLETLGEACEQTGWRIHAYVMMDNHYHLLLETPEANLVAGMKWLQSTYTQRYNGRHKIFGHLFQGRYKALVVDGQEGNYFGVVSTYIHLNPARAKLISVGQERLSRYRWSSYPFYLKGVLQRPGWLVTGRVMGNLGLGPEERDRYEAYMEGRVIELGIKAGRTALNEQWKRIRRGWYLGDDGFRGRMLKYVKEKLGKGRPTSYSGEAKRAHGQAEAQRLLGLGLAALKVGDRQLQDGAKGMPEKQALAWWLCQKTTVARRWVCERLGMGDESRVSKAIRRMKEGRDRGLAKLKERLEKTEKEANSFANE